ncbi:dolichyl-phosphate beta-glucosyltransferase [Streptomyces chiangmaiensis]|uniref:dolichyl-phosphate beta-glucosyltransferase n=1 Tax=Streptomyces chiangmaiensis TaxID=766497 RepID=A0ABU7FEQ9_9ACTN|nr:dolichyl-phosphate beta-glucosyltransferase [Streptomyces chiangmaiensis]MED7822647.1 dolichyl-phosphate beta-glucosyltransferase [Streptomyces chiangmaiensis]
MSAPQATDVMEDVPVVPVDLSVVVPAHNEERRLGPTLDAIVGYLGANEGRFGEWEVLVVDDGSTDGTRDVVTAASGRDRRVRLVTSPDNHGKGHALRLGVLASRGRRVLVTDADLATPIEELEALAKALAEGPSAAIGSRSAPGATIERHQSRIRELLGRAGNLLIRRIAVPGIRDTQCGFKLFHGDRAREAFAASRLHGWGIDVEILQHFRRSGWPVAEVPVRWAHQPGSKVRPQDYARVLAELAALKVRSVRPADLLAVAAFLLMAVGLYAGRWADPNHRYLPESLQDQNQWEWFFAVTADNVAHLRNPLFTTLQGYPDGVNLMANTVMLGLTVPLAPVTLLLGPAITLALAMTLGLAATAAAWYRLIVKRVVGHRGAAFTGAALAAFAPPMVSHANAHPNFTVLFMIPLIIERALRLCGGERVVRDGVVLGLMLLYQIFLGEEPLLLASLGMVLFAGAYAILRRDVTKAAWRPLLKGLAIGAAVCLPLVALPLYWQFFGPQSYKSVLHGDHAGNSPLALVSFAGRSLVAGNDETANALSLNPTEQNAFYGWPLVALAFAIVIRLWEHTLVKALAFTAVAAAVLSLGPRFRIPLSNSTVPGPWALIADKPLFESVIEGRVAMICAPALGMLLAVAIERLARTPNIGNQFIGFTAVAAALIPIVPAPLKSVERAQVPAFIADGTWTSYIGKDETLVPIPLPDSGNAEALHWQTAAGLKFKLPGGYFNGPYGSERIGIYTASPRYTSSMLRDISFTGVAPVIGKNWQAQARADFAYWKAGVLVLPPQQYQDQLRQAVDKLVGRPGTWVGGVWVWDLHD